MSEKERQDIIKLFKINTKYYLSIEDIQEYITNITYLFWNAKYISKVNISNYSIESILDFLKQYTKENEKLIWEIFDNIRGRIEESNLYNILVYLDRLPEEKLIDIICDDYNMYSRYNFSTPNSVNELVYKILEKNNKKESKVIDICSYTGNFLVNYAKHNKEYEYTGIDINPRFNTITNAKLNSLKVRNEVICSNVFRYYFKNKYDKIFCNYPFGIKIAEEDYQIIKNYDNKLKYNFAKKTMYDWAFVNTVINLLADNGKAVVLMNNACLYKLPDAEYRKLLVENGYIEAVISLPEKLFSNTSIPTTLLIISENNKNIKFISAEKMYLNKTNKYINNELNIESIIKEYESTQNTENTKILEIEELEKNNYSLYTQNYMDAEQIHIKNAKLLKEVCEDIYRGYQISSNEVNSYSENIDNREEYKIVNITNIVEGTIEEELTKIYPDNNKLEKYLLKDKDLLVSSKGTTTKVAVVEIKENEKYIPSGNFTVLRLNTKIINPKYLRIFFESKKGVTILNSIKSGGVLPAINLSQFKEINIPVPPIEEQNLVVAKYLAKKDEIDIFKNKLKKLEENLVDIANEEF